MIVHTYCNNCDAHIGTCDTDTDYRAQSKGDRHTVGAGHDDLVFHLTDMCDCDTCGNSMPVTIHIFKKEEE